MRHLIRLRDWLIPLVLLVGLTLPFWTTNLDVAVAGRFFTPGVGWEYKDSQPWALLYHYGVIPAWVVALSGLGVFIASLWATRLKPHRRAAIFLVLVMVAGPGLLVNVIFKENWGRPRPRDIYAFEGDRAYVAPWVKSAPQNGNSFASGHASTGFYLFVPYFLFRRRSKAWAWFFIALGLGYGSLVGLARMIQGAHFLSDILWAFGFVYLSALGLSYVLRPDGDIASQPSGIAAGST